MDRGLRAPLSPHEEVTLRPRVPDVQLTDHDEQPKTCDLLRNRRSTSAGMTPSTDPDALAAYAAQRDGSAFEPFEKLGEVVAPIVFDPQVIFEAELVDQ